VFRILLPEENDRFSVNIKSTKKETNITSEQSNSYQLMSLTLRDLLLKVLMDLQTVLAAGDRLCGLVVRVPGYRSRGPG
jgi:hypothetical protein